MNDMPIKTGFMFPVTAELFEQFTRPRTVMSLIEGEILNDLNDAHRAMTDPLYRRHGPIESNEHKCARFGHELDDGEGYDIDGDPDEDDRITFRCWRCRAVVAEFVRTTT